MGIQNKIDIAGQKIQGMAQQVKGDIEIKTGQHVKGTIDKVRGQAHEMEADLRDKVEKSK